MSSLQSKNKTNKALDSIYSLSLVIVFISPFSYTVLLLLLVFRFISVPEAFKLTKPTKNNEDFVILCSHANYYNKIVTIITSLGLFFGLLLQRFPLNHPIIEGVIIIITSWAFFRLCLGRNALRNNRMPTPGAKPLIGSN